MKILRRLIHYNGPGSGRCQSWTINWSYTIAFRIGIMVSTSWSSGLCRNCRPGYWTCAKSWHQEMVESR